MRTLRNMAWALVALGFLAACGGEPEEAAPEGAAEPEAAESRSKKAAKKEKGKEALMAIEVPKAEISGKLLAPTVWGSAKDVEEDCARILGQASTLRDKVLADEGKRAAENTLVPLNDIYVLLDQVVPLSELMANVHPDKAVRDAAEKCQQDGMKFLNDLQLDRGMYDALSSMSTDGLDATALRSREHLLRDYRRSGVDKDEATRKRLSEIHEEMVKTGQEFSRRIREDKRSIEVAPGDLAGLPDDFVKAHAPGAGGKVKLSTDYPDFFPVQTYADSERVRKALYLEFLARAHPENDAALEKLLGLRHEYATTLGYPNWAEYNAEDKMARSQKAIGEFIDKVSGIARPRMNTDLRDILDRKKRDDASADRAYMWDRFYYVKKIQAERFGVDAQEVRKYFPFERVRDGVLAVNEKLFGVRFERLESAGAWHEDVVGYDVLEGGERIGRFYLDMHPRDGKYGHAAMFNVYTGITGRQLPVAALVCNFPEPTEDDRALMEHGDVTTFFHEFGHLMHHLLGSGYRWANLSGIACEWDFVEAPSQLLEEWSWDPEILASFTKHAETGEPIPKDLVEKMRAADEFGKGVHVMRQMFYAALSFAYHNRDPEGIDLLALLKETQDKYNPYPYVEGTWVYANFGHLEGYSSMYYTYMWSLNLAKDLFTRFEEQGLMNERAAADYRKYVVGAGGAVDASEMVRNFLGREPSFDAFRDYLQK